MHWREFIPLDLAGREAADHLCELLHGRGLSPSVLINNAGLARFTPFEECGPELLDLHLRLNLRTPFLLTQALLPSLKEGRGCVINVSSYFARRMVAGTPTAAYSASKGAIESLTWALAFELGPLGVRVNAIAPGTVDTPLVRGNLAIDAAEADARFAALAQRLYPLQRICRPEDVAEAALFLASPAASWITGAVLAVDGGLTLH